MQASSNSGRGVLLSANLPQLQSLIKRDPASYKEEFLQQWNHYQSILNIFLVNPDDQSQHFRDVVTFVTQLAPCYPKETAKFPSQISNLLREKFNELSPDVRKCLVSNLIILRKKNVLDSVDLLQSLFPLLPRISSTELRSFIRKTILSEIRVANQKRTDHRLNRAVQTMLFRMVEQGVETKDQIAMQGKRTASSEKDRSHDDALWAIVMTRDLWKRGVWKDSKTVSIVSLGCFHSSVKVQSAALHFFLDSEDEDDSDSDDDEDEIPNIKALEHRRTINKKTRSGDKKLRKTAKTIKKKKKEAAKGKDNQNFSALQLLNDPQTFAEKLFDNLSRNDKAFTLDHKIVVMQLLCRAMGIHALCVLGYYSYVMKFLTYRQLRITTILASLAQSVHDLTPPDVLSPVVHKLAQEFIHPGVGSEVIAAGLNTIREICKRQPWSMDEDLLGDLVEYRKSKDKGVTTAARSLLQLFRQAVPTMLKRRERGKEASMNIQNDHQPLAFGAQKLGTTKIEGLDLLEAHLRETGEDGGDESDDWNGWEVDSESSDSSSEEGWIDVKSDSDEDLVFSDSEDEEGGKKEVEPAAPEEVDGYGIAAEKILTPADYALMKDLQSRTEGQQGGSSAKRKFTATNSVQVGQSEKAIDEGDIVGPRKKAKATYEERMDSIKQGREGRAKFGSMKGKKAKESSSSSTNREKARNKPIMMVMASGAVRSKKKASLREKQRRIKKHNDNQKKRNH